MCKAGDYQELQGRWPPASQRLCWVGQSSDLQDPNSVLRDSLKQMQRGRKGGPFPDNSPRTFWSHLLCLGTLPYSLSASFNPKGPPCCRRGLSNLTLAMSPGVTSSSPGVMPRQNSVQGPQASPRKPTIPIPGVHPHVLLIAPRPSLLSLSHSQQPRSPEQQEWKKLSGRSGSWDPRSKASLLCPQRGIEPVH